MQKYFFLLILFSPVWSANAQVADDFSDGNFTTNPTWEGDTVKFEINSSKQLHLHTSGADTSELGTANTLINNTEWDFWIKLSFNTSANNYARVYLVSDHHDLKGQLNGYFLQIGGSKDSIAFFKQTGTELQTLFRGISTCTNHSTNILRFKMIHDSTRTWTLYIDDTGGTNYQEEGHCIDSAFSYTSWFGVFCQYTTSNATKFYFDDFYIGNIQVDNLPPRLDSINVTDSLHLTLTFSENLLISSTRDIHHYYSKMNGNPVLANPDTLNGTKIYLTFQNFFQDGTIDSLVISGISDQSGNIMVDTVVPFYNYQVKTWDIVMDEIMADPEPVVNLPESEYVELYNRTKFPISLSGWSFEYGSSSKTFPAVSIPPHGYLILTKGIMMNYYGSCVDLFTSYTTLPNAGAALVLKNSSGKVIHSMTYSSDWYQDPLKENGGWSLEMIDPDNPCGCRDNWKASTDSRGGTPGMINSVHAINKDVISPYVKRSEVISDSVIEIYFSESMDSLFLNSDNAWKINESGNNSINVTLNAPEYNSVMLNLTTPLERKQIYFLSCNNPPRDCAGNIMDTIRKARIGIPDSLIRGDLIINEILPKPAPTGEKFVEIFNRSEKVLNLKIVSLGLYDSLTNQITDLKSVTKNDLSIFPGDYFVLTKNQDDVKDRYYCPNPDAFVNLASMPSINSDHGTLVLARENDGALIDKVNYSQSMYSKIITNSDGVSLERLNPFLSSEDIGNWHSASQSCGFATPGYKNSEFLLVNEGKEEIDLSPLVFTPDDDGKDDVLLIGFSLNNAGYQANILIFNAYGDLIRTLARNRLLSTKDGIIWDGKDDKNRISPIGIYIVYIELVTTEGTVRKIKKTCVLGGKR